MDKFKMEAAAEVGVNLKQMAYKRRYHFPREAGSVGGQMVKKDVSIHTASVRPPQRVLPGHEVARCTTSTVLPAVTADEESAESGG